ncbi:MAG: hypothetical protein M3463_14850 [Verrucomicrobiota bacterium]|nr:hypothetical protein [Verrucomicrobiota bacterium]
MATALSPSVLSQLETVRACIVRQEDHHRMRTFCEEYVEFLRKHEILFDDKYLW